MKRPVIALAALQVFVLAIVAVTGTGGSDAAGNAMSQGFVALAFIVAAIFLIPALVLAFAGKAQKLSLILAIVPLIIIVAGLSAA